MVVATPTNVVFHKYYIRQAAAFTLIEALVAIAVLAIGVVTTIGALTKINTMAATGRNTTGAYAVLMNQVDLFQSMSAFNPQKTPQNADPCSGQIPLTQVPKDNCHGSYPLFDMTIPSGSSTATHDLSVDGATYNVPVYEYKDSSGNVVLVVNASGPYSSTNQGLKVTVTDLNFAATTPSSGPYQAVFTITYTYLNKTYTYSMSSIRSSDI
jgi:type II secretory pathway pseudopilin PulG